MNEESEVEHKTTAMKSPPLLRVKDKDIKNKAGCGLSVNEFYTLPAFNTLPGFSQIHRISYKDLEDSYLYRRDWRVGTNPPGAEGQTSVPIFNNLASWY